MPGMVRVAGALVLRMLFHIVARRTLGPHTAHPPTVPLRLYVRFDDEPSAPSSPPAPAAVRHVLLWLGPATSTPAGCGASPPAATAPMAAAAVPDTNAAHEAAQAAEEAPPIEETGRSLFLTSVLDVVRAVARVACTTRGGGWEQGWATLYGILRFVRSVLARVEARDGWGGNEGRGGRGRGDRGSSSYSIKHVKEAFPCLLLQP